MYLSTFTSSSAASTSSSIQNGVGRCFGTRHDDLAAVVEDRDIGFRFERIGARLDGVAFVEVDVVARHFVSLMRIGVDVVLLVRTGRHRETAQHAAVVQVAGLDLAGHGFAARRTDRHRRRHLLERQGQRFVEVENPEVAHARPARTDEQAARPEVDRDLLVVLSVLILVSNPFNILIDFS